MAGPAAWSDPERTAVEAIAARGSLSRQGSTAILSVDGRRIALAAASLPSGFLPDAPPGVRLREDKVALRVTAALETSIGSDLPGGSAVLVTLGAPIRLPNRLLKELGDHLRTRLAEGGGEAGETLDILGNRVRWCRLGDAAAWTSRVVAFVFSGDPAPSALASAAVALAERVAAAGSAALAQDDASAADAAWLVVATAGWPADHRSLHHILSRLAAAAEFESVLVVSPGGRVEAV